MYNNGKGYDNIVKGVVRCEQGVPGLLVGREEMERVEVGRGEYKHRD